MIIYVVVPGFYIDIRMSFCFLVKLHLLTIILYIPISSMVSAMPVKQVYIFPSLSSNKLICDDQQRYPNGLIIHNIAPSGKPSDADHLVALYKQCIRKNEQSSLSF